jgi:hypothetical protein
MNNKIRVYGNNGGDILEIEDSGDGVIKISSESCCVYDLQSIEVPVEFMTGLIAKTMLEYGAIDKIIDSFEWSTDFKEQLKCKIKQH